MDNPVDLNTPDAGDLMQCEKCRSTEIDSFGACRVCGYVNPRTAFDAQAPQAEPRYLGAFEIESSTAGNATDLAEGELPQWRIELSRRLQEIKQRRENIVGQERPPVEVSPPSAPAALRVEEEMAPPSPPSTLGPPGPDSDDSAVSAAPTEQPAPAAAAVPRTASRRPRRKGAAADKSESTEGPPASEEKDRTVEDIRTLIDRMTERKPVVEEPPETEPAAPERVFIGPEPETDRLILLSRAFSGLVDLIIVILIASAVIFAVDIIEGIEVFDSISLLYYLALLFAAFLVYSVFFLSTANQTIGMMITDLRVVNCLHLRPTLGQVFARALSFPIALLPAGVGLIAGFFDRDSRCLHDRISRTQVIRLLLF